MSNSSPPLQLSEALTPEQRRAAARSLWTIGALGAASLIGVGSSLYLVHNYPLLLIAQSPLGRHLILVAPIVNPYAFVAVAVSRSVAFCVPCFYLGRAAGPVAVQWLESRSPRFGRAVRWLERIFRSSEKRSFALILLFPGPAMSTIAGDSGMRPAVYVSFLIAGLVLRMQVVLWLGEWLRDPIELVIAWIGQNWVPGTVVLVAGIALYQWRQRQRASRTEASSDL